MMRRVHLLPALLMIGACGSPYPYDDESTGDGGATSASGGEAGAAQGGAGHGPLGSGGDSSGSGGTVDSSGGAPEEADAAPAAPPPPPSVTGLSPAEAAFGEEITIDGEGLGSKSRANVFVVIDDGSEAVTLTPASDGVVSWTETRIVFRVPFPAEGDISVETPQGTAEAGTFRATWVSTWSHPVPQGAGLIASVVDADGRVAMLFDTSPATLLFAGDPDAPELGVDLTGLVSSSVELYVDEGVVEAVAISSGPSPEIVHLARQGDALVAAPTGIALDATKHAVAGGPDGAAVWMLRDGGWARARPMGGTWAIDRSGVADPKPGARRHTAGATSDGALYIAWAVDTGNFLDDMEAAFIRRLSPDGTEFAPQLKASQNADDYLTDLALDSRGRGIVIRYCGSDRDPFGLSGTDYTCMNAGISTGGAQALRVPKEGTQARHGFAERKILEAACDSKGTLRVKTDPAATGEAVLWPCPAVVASEIGPDGGVLSVVGVGADLHLMERRIAEPAP